MKIKIFFILFCFLQSKCLFADTYISGLNKFTFLSAGYDTKNQLTTGQCIDGNITFAGKHTAEEYFYLNPTYSDLVEIINGGVKGSLNLQYFNVNSQFDYASRNSASDLNLSYTDIISIIPKRPTLINYKIAKGMESLIINSDGSIKSNIELFCGDEFITQAVIGAKLLININFLFKNSIDKKEFFSKVGANIFSIAEIKRQLKGIDESLLAKTIITIDTKQIGGDSKKLSDAISSDTVYCSIDKAAIKIDSKEVKPIEVCLKTLEELSNYKANFSAQLKNKSFDPHNPNGWAYFGWISTKYKNALISYNNKPIQLIPKDPSPPLAQEIKHSRQKLKDAFDYQMKLSKTAFELMHFNIPLSKMTKLQETSELISSNLYIIASAVQHCFGEEISNCVESTSYALSRLKEFDENDFIKFENTDAKMKISGLWVSNDMTTINIVQYNNKVTAIVNSIKLNNLTSTAKGGYLGENTFFLAGAVEKDLFKDNSNTKCKSYINLKVKYVDKYNINIQFKPQHSIFKFNDECEISPDEVCVFDKEDIKLLKNTNSLNTKFCENVSFKKFE
ncbi:hypothetical protein [Fluviispira multicolorata]|uniref:Uncharacterized protein n=1 Tax=Fluviispira multicolorata TaxID=2654512 RepID=A0A833N5Y8_9BACT|nr:hypothetical protein [Fluviispira multicolorata]KAB8031869.1 hypothetical protein GCL57_04285 [Fluviispira multicolorata]